MFVRRATINDIEKIKNLLSQVLDIHHNGRPDIFKKGSRKYTDDELKILIADDEKPIFVADCDGVVSGYAFCIFQQIKNNNILTDIKSLYIDDLCVDENSRGSGIGRLLYDYVVDFAKKNNCYNITLNVWSLNNSALSFYEKCGLSPQKIVMEKIL